MNSRFNRSFGSGQGHADLDFVFVADADNLSHTPGRRGTLNVPALARLLKSRGVTHSIVVSNWLSPMEEALWAGAGAGCVSVRRNCDDAVAAIITDLARRGAQRILLGSGDAGYADLVRDVRRQGVGVHLLAHSRQLGSALKAAASGYAWIDRYLWVPEAVDGTAATVTLH